MIRSELLLNNFSSTIYLVPIFFRWLLYIRRRQWHPTPVLLPGKSHGRRGLVGCSTWGCSELDTTEWFHFHFSLSCIGEGNGNPLQCSCLENPRDGGAWWAAVCGVAQSRTRLKRLSSSNNHRSFKIIFLDVCAAIYQLSDFWKQIYWGIIYIHKICSLSVYNSVILVNFCSYGTFTTIQFYNISICFL